MKKGGLLSFITVVLLGMLSWAGVQIIANAKDIYMMKERTKNMKDYVRKDIMPRFDKLDNSINRIKEILIKHDTPRGNR